MDPNQLGKIYWKKIIEGSEKKIPDIENPSVLDPLQELFGERKDQRKRLLDFIVRLTVASFCLLVSIVVIQTIFRMFDRQNFTILSGHELEVLVTGVFGQIIGLIYVIVKSLWDDKNYLDSLKK